MKAIIMGADHPQLCARQMDAISVAKRHGCSPIYSSALVVQHAMAGSTNVLAIKNLQADGQ
ncbi:hypothetical protein ACFONL_10670 [Camelimonas fluminis]|uniref:Uncharacterized protein n=1 Tax=Camelimonas fluminis TaxID=1576911 RepID=A0ABV7UGL2_9HYPH|nr:hypothetical protein [Camelimonas fluminis]